MTGDPSPPFAHAPSIANPPQSLGAAVGRGLSWLSVSLVIGKLAGAVAQLALGRWITEEQFGDFAIVASVATLVRVFQAGGVPQLLIQRGHEEFNRLLGAAFWLNAALGLAFGVLLAAAAPLIARSYDTPRLAVYLWIVALSLPVGAPITVLRAQLRLDLQFKAVAVIAALVFVVRHGASVALAALGLGVMALVLPLLLVTLFEITATYRAARIQPWRRPPQFDEWSSLIGDSLWVMTTSICRGLSRTGDYLVLGALAPAAVVGRYFFGYQITTQIVELVGTNLQHVLFPALSRVVSDPERQARATVRAIRMLVLVAAPISLGLAVAVRPAVELLDATIWKHKWASTIPLMQILAVAAPIRMFTDVMSTSLSSRGRFRGTALLTLMEGIWLMVSTGAAYLLVGPDLTRLAAIIAASQIVFSLTTSTLLLRQFGVAPGTFFSAFLPSWGLSVAAAAASWITLQLLPEISNHVVELASSSILFVLFYGAAARAFLSQDLVQLTSLVPRPLGRLLQSLLLLPPTSI